jgi:hypothetical protein
VSSHRTLEKFGVRQAGKQPLPLFRLVIQLNRRPTPSTRAKEAISSTTPQTLLLQARFFILIREKNYKSRILMLCVL